MSARKERQKKEYFTLGQYTTRHDFTNHNMTLDQANLVRLEGLRIAEFRKEKIKWVKGTGMKASSTTPSLPAGVWQEAIDNILKPTT